MTPHALYSVAIYIDRVPNRNSRLAILLREGWREVGKVKKRTLTNLTDWPADRVERLRRVLKDEPLLNPDDAFEIIRSRPHGHVVAVLGTAQHLGLPQLLAKRSSRQRNLVLAMLCTRILDPRSKLATARALRSETLAHSLGETLDLEDGDDDELYGALDWLLERQAPIEQQLAKRHLRNGSIVLYDLTSTYFEGRRCPLARRAYSRDGKRSTLQIVFGLLCDAEGCPVPVEVFECGSARASDP